MKNDICETPQLASNHYEVTAYDYNVLVQAHNELLDYVKDLHQYIASLIGLLIEKGMISEAEYIAFGNNFELERDE